MSTRVRLCAGGLVLATTLFTMAPRAGGAPPPKGISLTSLGVYQTLRFDTRARSKSRPTIPATRRAFLTFAEEPFNGKDDSDGDYDRLFSFGGRSFSVWSWDGTLVFDSGDALEQLTAAAYPANFNAHNTNNTLDDRSDDKGPAPEGVTVAQLFGRPYLFVMLERIGGVVIYEITDPRSPRFVQYVNMRSFAAAPGTVAAGDLGAEGARVIPAEDSPNGRPLLMVSNEVSGSLRLFEIQKAD